MKICSSNVDNNHFDTFKDCSGGLGQCNGGSVGLPACFWKETAL